MVRRVGALTEQGFNEVVLTGVDLTAWGQDFPEQSDGKPMLGDLVARILRDVPELPRLRLSSSSTRRKSTRPYCDVSPKNPA